MESEMERKTVGATSVVDEWCSTLAQLMDKEAVQRARKTFECNRKLRWRRTPQGWVVEETNGSIEAQSRRSAGFIGSSTKATTRSSASRGSTSGISVDYANYLTWLSNTYGNTYKNPRSYETYIMVSETNRDNTHMYSGIKRRFSDNKHIVGLPRWQYHREMNRQRWAKLIIDKESGDKWIDEETITIGKKPKTWKSHYPKQREHQTHKYNYWGNLRYNWGDYEYLRELRIIERCNYLAKQILAKKQ